MGTRRNRDGELELDIDAELSKCRQILYAPETDWEDVYLIIRGSFIGADFPAQRFLRTPIRTIRALLVQIDYKEKSRANTLSATAAKGQERIILYLRQLIQLQVSKKLPEVKLSPEDLLPFPGLRPPGMENYNGLPERTRKILIDLGKERRIPMHVLMTLLHPPEPED